MAKVGIIGADSSAPPPPNAMMLNGTCSEIVLIDRDETACQGRSRRHRPRRAARQRRACLRGRLQRPHRCRAGRHRRRLQPKTGRIAAEPAGAQRRHPRQHRAANRRSRARCRGAAGLQPGGHHDQHRPRPAPDAVFGHGLRHHFGQRPASASSSANAPG